MARRRKSGRPLLQRAVLHALKKLATEHPRTALSVAGSAAGYALKETVDDVKHAATDTVDSIKHAVIGEPEPEPAQPPKEPIADRLTPRECEQLLVGLSRRQRAALADFARRH